MSNFLSAGQARRAYRTGSVAGWLMTMPMWPLLGWLGDRPRNVQRFEPGVAHLGAWVSTVFHVGGALVVGVLMGNGVWGLTWGAFAGLVLARRLAAREPWPVPLRYRDVRDGLIVMPHGKEVAIGVALLVSATLTEAAFEMPSVLGGIQDLASLLVTPALIAWLVCGGVTFRTGRQAAEMRRAKIVRQLAVVCGMTEREMQEQAGLTFHVSGGITVSPVPAKMALKVASDPTAVETAIAAVIPDLTLHPDSQQESSTRVDFVPVDVETLKRRQYLAKWDGMVGGELPVDAPTYDDDGAPERLVITEDDLR